MTSSQVTIHDSKRIAPEAGIGAILFWLMYPAMITASALWEENRLHGTPFIVVTFVYMVLVLLGITSAILGMYGRFVMTAYIVIMVMSCLYGIGLVITLALGATEQVWQIKVIMIVQFAAIVSAAAVESIRRLRKVGSPR